MIRPPHPSGKPRRTVERRGLPIYRTPSRDYETPRLRADWKQKTLAIGFGVDHIGGQDTKD